MIKTFDLLIKINRSKYNLYTYCIQFMGVKHFWIWLKNHHHHHIRTVNINATSAGINTDVLAIDMNGIIHTCAQKVYLYGNFAPKVKSLLDRPQHKKDRKVFELVGETLDFYIRFVAPNKRLLLCIDGVAGLSKMSQQRQRRFKSAKENSGLTAFDSNCITPGTTFMEGLSNYLDWFIHMKITTTPNWMNLEVILSDAKDPGEGEHKIINYIRTYAKRCESYCIHGMDADLIFLGLTAPCGQICILREDSFKLDRVHVVDITALRIAITDHLAREVSIGSRTISDFVLMCYAVGNDFLPQLPGIEILQGGVDTLISVYADVVPEFGSLATMRTGRLILKRKSFHAYISALAELEEEMINFKLKQQHKFFPEPLVASNSTIDHTGKACVDLENYKKMYYAKKFPKNVSVKEICLEYLKGVQWVLNYYTTGIPSWTWVYPWDYSPFVSDLVEYFPKYKNKAFELGEPSLPFQQLMMVLPSKSSNLLPNAIAHVMTKDSPVLGNYFPDDFSVDVSGKRKEWEGIVILPKINVVKFKEVYDNIKSLIPPSEMKRNQRGNIYRYFRNNKILIYYSKYGNLLQNRCKRVSI